MSRDERPTAIDLAAVADFPLGSVQVRPSVREVVAGASRETLEPRVMQVLVCLAQRRGQVVSRDQLIEACWGGRVVGEDAVNRCIAAVRRVGQQDAGFGVETIARVGYRLTEDRVGDNRSHTAIAILPFTSLAGEQAHEELADAITDQLITTLARIPSQLRVPARASLFAYKGKNVDARKVASELGVDLIVEGSVSRTSERTRVAAQLIDGRSGYQLWSRSFEGASSAADEFRDEVTISLADALNPGGAGPLTSARRAPTRSLQAYQMFLQAKSLTACPTEHNLHAALEIMQQVLTIDPGFARAWQALSVIRGHDFLTMDYPLTGVVPDAERDAQRALSLDASLPGAHAVLGLVAASRGRWVEAEERLNVALSLLPGDAEFRIVRSIFLGQTAGHLRAALREADAAGQGAPLTSHFTSYIGVARLLAGQTAEGRAWIELAIARGLPANAGAVPDMLALAAMREHRYQDAVQHLSDGLRPAWRSAGGIEVARLVYGAPGDSSRVRNATEALQRFEARVGVEPADQWSGKRLMLWYTLLGAVDCAYSTAHHLLDRLATIDSIGIGWGFLWIPEMQPFRRDARFHGFAERLHLVEYWRQYGPPDDCEIRDGKLACQ